MRGRKRQPINQSVADGEMRRGENDEETEDKREEKNNQYLRCRSSCCPSVVVVIVFGVGVELRLVVVLLLELHVRSSDRFGREEDVAGRLVV